MHDLKNCPKWGLFTDISNKDCPYCGYHYGDRIVPLPVSLPSAVFQPDIPSPPPLNARRVFKSVRAPARSDQPEDPRIGDVSAAFRQTSSGAGTNPAHSHYVIVFAKRNICVEFVTTGPDPDYELVRHLAQKSAANLP
jgi:hypothetical protein